MKSLLGVAISVGVLAGLWTFVSAELALVTWAAFVAWACFFAAGGGTGGLAKGLAANLAGVFWAWVVSLGLTHVSSSTVALSVMVTVIAFILCVEAAWSPLSFIPGGFAGAAVFFGTQFDVTGTLVAIVAGALLGFVSEILAGKIQAAVDHQGSPAGTTPAHA